MLPGWLIDALLAALLVGIALIVERLTEGRLFTSTIVLSVGIGSFVLLRLGAAFAQVGRTVGCLFVFAMTWVLPCAAAFFFTINPDRGAIVRDSLPFFTVVGFFLIVIMLVTFERLRLADVARFGEPSEGDIFSG